MWLSKELPDGGFEILLGHASGMIEANDTLPVDQHMQGYRISAVLFVVRLADRHRYVAQEPVVGVADLDDMAQLSVGWRRTAPLDISVLLGRRDDGQTLRAIFVDELRQHRAFGPAFHAPVGPEEYQDHLSFHFIEARHARADVQTAFETRRRLPLETRRIDVSVNVSRRSLGGRDDRAGRQQGACDQGGNNAAHGALRRALRALALDKRTVRAGDGPVPGAPGREAPAQPQRQAVVDDVAVSSRDSVDQGAEEIDVVGERVRGAAAKV